MTLTATDRYRLASGTIPVNGTTTEKVLIPAAVLAKLLPRLTSAQVRLGVDVIAGTTWLTLADDTTTVPDPHPRRRVPQGLLDPGADPDPHRHPRPRPAPAGSHPRRLAVRRRQGAKNNPVTITVNQHRTHDRPRHRRRPRQGHRPRPAGHHRRRDRAWTTGANPAFLLDAIATLTADEVTLHLTDPDRPMILTDAGDTDYRHVLMPVRLAR
jgi:DNA polymerase-3 subunit beta